MRRLGHFVLDGKTEVGIDKFKLSFARQNLIIDHVEMTRQELLERDEERKRKQREKRSSQRDPVISPDEVTKPVCDFTGQGDVISPTRDNLLEELLESFNSEEGETLKEHTEVAGDAPFPAPQEEADARLLIIRLLEGKRPSPAQVLFLQHKLMAGDLRQSHIDRLEDAA
ncbi:hypothetical protein [Mesorhizobium sp. YM1C-6-2]|uniref:hypothetical protein n=1 Tax=Mesorhizobium sp. YM1C-6-2 TaxID=1827501 RepID=UPI000EF1F7F7|nr:hypothetical protein [Mesorhizobium sp. YM1C-6-2]RLP22247.1 hypothetical protein D8676_25230 [Mesorhizobium sp. YM1C-6-2]